MFRDIDNVAVQVRWPLTTGVAQGRYYCIGLVSKGDCIIMGDFRHGNIKWDTLQSTGVEDQRFLCLIQGNFLTQHVLEPTRAARVLDIVLSSQKEFVDNVVRTIGQQRS